jgi:hypothetical protein
VGSDDHCRIGCHLAEDTFDAGPQPPAPLRFEVGAQSVDLLLLGERQGIGGRRAFFGHDSFTPSVTADRRSRQTIGHRPRPHDERLVGRPRPTAGGARDRSRAADLRQARFYRSSASHDKPAPPVDVTRSGSRRISRHRASDPSGLFPSSRTGRTFTSDLRRWDHARLAKNKSTYAVLAGWMVYPVV